MTYGQCIMHPLQSHTSTSCCSVGICYRSTPLLLHGRPAAFAHTPPTYSEEHHNSCSCFYNAFMLCRWCDRCCVGVGWNCVSLRTRCRGACRSRRLRRVVHASQQSSEIANLCTITRSGTRIKGARFQRVPRSSFHDPRSHSCCARMAQVGRLWFLWVGCCNWLTTWV
jgi:hypothetical protein